jgi:hypothetical protein
MPPKMPAVTPLSTVLANADAALVAEQNATAESIDAAVARLAQERTAAQMQADATLKAEQAAREKALADQETLMRSARDVLPFLYAMQENFIVAVAGHTRESTAMGYAEFCLRAKISEALTEYALQVHSEKGVDAVAFTRLLAVKAGTTAGHKGEK